MNMKLVIKPFDQSMNDTTNVSTFNRIDGNRIAIVFAESPKAK